MMLGPKDLAMALPSGAEGPVQGGVVSAGWLHARLSIIVL